MTTSPPWPAISAWTGSTWSATRWAAAPACAPPSGTRDEYAAVAPDVDAFPTLMDKTGKLISSDYDWTDEVRGITVPTLLVYADTDSITTTHAAEFFGLLGGGSTDGGWDGSTPTPMRLAIIPNTTHYNIWYAPQLPPIVADFLAEQAD